MSLSTLLPPMPHVEQMTRHQRGPAGLVARAEPAAGVSVKVFVEQQQILPVRVGGEPPVLAVTGTASLTVRQEDARQPGGDLARHLAQIHHPSRSGGALN